MRRATSSFYLLFLLLIASAPVLIAQTGLGSGRLPPARVFLRGQFSYGYSGAGDLNEFSGTLAARLGRFDLGLGGHYRDAGPYLAPKGRFGDVTLEAPLRVEHSGIRDTDSRAELGFSPRESVRLSARYARYDARNAGFRFVEPEPLGDPGGAGIRLQHPEQETDRISVGYTNTAIGSALVDRVDVTAYEAHTQRNLGRSILVPEDGFSALGAVGSAASESRTRGARVEASRSLGAHLLTYGVDAYLIHADHSDSPEDGGEVPVMRDATYRSLNVFSQGEVQVGPRVDLVVWAQWRQVAVREESAGARGVNSPAANDAAFVGAVRIGVAVAGGVRLVAGAERGFRSPNLVERFFEGPTSYGASSQRANPALRAETRDAFEVGVTVQRGALHAEGFVFGNDVRDGIRLAHIGETSDGLPIFRHLNAGRLTETGARFQADLRVGPGIFVGASTSTFRSTPAGGVGAGVGDDFSSRATGSLGYRQPAGRFYASFEVRYSGVRREGGIVASPSGARLPAFAVSTIRGGVKVLRAHGTTHRVDFVVGNLFNTLYAEFPNTGFFRPEPARYASVSWTLGF